MNLYDQASAGEDVSQMQVARQLEREEGDSGVSRAFEDPQLVKAMADTEASADVIGKLQQLALDCAALSVELQLFALPKIEVSMGASKEELLDFVLSLDPAQIQNRPSGSRSKRSRRWASLWVGRVTPSRFRQARPGT